MSNKMNATRKEGTVIPASNQEVTPKTASQKVDEKHREEFTELVFDAGRYIG